MMMWLWRLMLRSIG